MIKIGLVGCKGKLAQEIIRQIPFVENYELRRAITSKNSPYIGEKITFIDPIRYEVTIENDLLVCTDCDILIDATSPKAFLDENYEKYKMLKKPVIIATTGFRKDDMLKIMELSESIPIVQEANFSIELLHFIQALQEYVRVHRDLDVSIVEAHHIYKKDKPSGTAIHIRDEINKIDPNLKVEILCIRAGVINGEHCVRFANLNGEEISFIHKASSKKAFADGILSTIPFMLTKKNGFYKLADMQ